MRIQVIILIYLLNTVSCASQSSIDLYIGGWSGQMVDKDPFLFDIEIHLTGGNSAARFTGKNTNTNIVLESENDRYLVGHIPNQLTIRIDTTDTAPIAFIQTGHHLSNVKLRSKAPGILAGEWNLLIGESILPTLYLSLDKSENDYYTASTFFKEPTFHYMWGSDFKNSQNQMAFRDIRSNINFTGLLENDRINLTLNFLEEKTKIELSPMPYDEWIIGQTIDSVYEENSPNHFPKLWSDLKNGTLSGTHAVIISQHGKIIFEKYFQGFSASTIHDTRSLSKSFASAIVGIAIHDKKIANENSPIKQFFELQYPEVIWEKGKENILIHHLLTMSSGLDAIDFGLDRTSYANEGAYQSQNDWSRHILTAPMIYQPGEKANYGSANPHLLSSIVSSGLEERLEFYIHKKLFQPLSIYSYRIQTNNFDQPYFGGGWYFTPRDLLKFGQLYLHNGTWEGEEIISSDWIQKSINKHTLLENTRDKNQYGYLFWHKDYYIMGRKIESIEARGAGGQYLMIVPEYQMVVVITSGNYRNNKGFQPEIIMKKYILTQIQ